MSRTAERWQVGNGYDWGAFPSRYGNRKKFWGGWALHTGTPVNAVERTFQGVIACRGYRRTWAFPREVDELLRQATAGRSVLHLFGGQASFGLRLDADRTTKPHVVGNAFYPPFACESMDVVICDPPYRPALAMWESCIRPALCIARESVWWFSPHSMGGHGQGQRIKRWWAVVPSEQSGIRYLVEHERLRHPPGCRNIKALPAQVAKYDWRTHVEHPNLPLSVGGSGQGDV